MRRLQLGLNLDNIFIIACDRSLWKDLVEALCVPSPPCNFDEDALLTSDMAHMVVRDVLPPLNPKNPSETFIFERRLTGNNFKKINK